MGYCLTSDVRLLTGLTDTDISNHDLQELINLSSTMMVEDLTIAVTDEEPTGSINGVNNTFEIDKYPIADTNADKTVSSLDVTVYGWTIRDDPSTKSTIAVSNVYSRDGIIITATAPSTSIKQITVDYSFTIEESLNWELIKVACVYLTAYLFSIKKFTLMPTTMARGPIRFHYNVKPYDEYLKKYDHMLSLIKSKLHIMKKSQEMSLERTRMRQ